jgi:hypothetical protein
VYIISNHLASYSALYQLTSPPNLCSLVSAIVCLSIHAQPCSPLPNYSLLCYLRRAAKANDKGVLRARAAMGTLCSPNVCPFLLSLAALISSTPSSSSHPSSCHRFRLVRLAYLHLYRSDTLYTKESFRNMTPAHWMRRHSSLSG